MLGAEEVKRWNGTQTDRDMQLLSPTQLLLLSHDIWGWEPCFMKDKCLWAIWFAKLNRENFPHACMVVFFFYIFFLLSFLPSFHPSFLPFFFWSAVCPYPSCCLLIKDIKKSRSFQVGYTNLTFRGLSSVLEERWSTMMPCPDMWLKDICGFVEHLKGTIVS